MIYNILVKNLKKFNMVCTDDVVEEALAVVVDFKRISSVF